MAARRQDARFWLMRDWFGRVRFRLLRALLRRRRSLGEGVTAVAVAREIVWAISLPALLAAVSVAFLAWFDQSFSFALLDGAGSASPLRSVVTSLAGAMDGWTEALAPGQPAEEAHAALLVAGAQVTGVFLGLYFTAVSVVASTAYGNVPPELRSVLIEDEVGNVYLRLVGYTGAACLFALGALAVGYSLGPASALVFALLGSASILSFLFLGKRVFQFLDPEAVTNSLARDIAVAVKSVSGKGILASDRSIQAHHQKVAARSLEAWEELASVSIGRSQSASSLRKIGQGAASLLHRYSEAKLAIPKTSFWFQRTYKHPSHLLAGSSELEVASRAGWWMPPRLEPDHLWLERRLSEIVQRVVMALLERGDDRTCAGLLESFQRWIARSAHQFSVSQLEVGFSIASDLARAAGRTSPGTRERADPDGLGRLALVDGTVGMVPAAVASLNRRLSDQSLDQLLSSASKAAAQFSLSLAEFPPNARMSIESFRKQHSFETDVEGSLHTPPWFVGHHVARLLSVDVKTTFISLLAKAEQWLPALAKSLRESGALEGSALVIQRGMESVGKLESSATSTHRVLEALKQRRVDTAGREWPEGNVEEWKERLRLLRRRLVNELVSLTPLLGKKPPKGNLPDSFGFAYTTLCHEAITALEEVDATTFGRVYTVLVPGALRAHERVRSELAERPAEDVLYFAAEVMLDFIEISGYAYVWKFALGEREFWDSVTSDWDRFLSKHPNPAALIQLIVFEEALHEGTLGIAPRSGIRWEWKRRLQLKLEERGFAPQVLSPRVTPRVIPIDPIVSRHLRAWDMGHARDLMLSEYFLRRPEALGLDLSRGVASLRAGATRVSENRAAGRVEGTSGRPGASR